MIKKELSLLLLSFTFSLFLYFFPEFIQVLEAADGTLAPGLPALSNIVAVPVAWGSTELVRVSEFFTEAAKPEISTEL